MRDCIFLLADAEMKAAFEGFLSRPNFHLSLGTSPQKSIPGLKAQAG